MGGLYCANHSDEDAYTDLWGGQIVQAVRKLEEWNTKYLMGQIDDWDMTSMKGTQESNAHQKKDHNEEDVLLQDQVPLQAITTAEFNVQASRGTEQIDERNESSSGNIQKLRGKLARQVIESQAVRSQEEQTAQSIPTNQHLALRNKLASDMDADVAQSYEVHQDAVIVESSERPKKRSLLSSRKSKPLSQEEDLLHQMLRSEDLSDPAAHGPLSRNERSQVSDLVAPVPKRPKYEQIESADRASLAEQIVRKHRIISSTPSSPATPPSAHAPEIDTLLDTDKPFTLAEEEDDIQCAVPVGRDRAVQTSNRKSPKTQPKMPVQSSTLSSISDSSDLSVQSDEEKSPQKAHLPAEDKVDPIPSVQDDASSGSHVSPANLVTSPELSDGKLSQNSIKSGEDSQPPRVSPGMRPGAEQAFLTCVTEPSSLSQTNDSPVEAKVIGTPRSDARTAPSSDIWAIQSGHKRVSNTAKIPAGHRVEQVLQTELETPAQSQTTIPSSATVNNTVTKNGEAKLSDPKALLREITVRDLVLLGIIKYDSRLVFMEYLASVTKRGLIRPADEDEVFKDPVQWADMIQSIGVHKKKMSAKIVWKSILCAGKTLEELRALAIDKITSSNIQLDQMREKALEQWKAEDLHRKQIKAEMKALVPHKALETPNQKTNRGKKSSTNTTPAKSPKFDHSSLAGKYYLCSTGLNDHDQKYFTQWKTKLNNDQSRKCGEKTIFFASDPVDGPWTHLLASVDENLHCKRTSRYLQAIANRKWILSFQWLIESHKADGLQSEEAFLIKGDQATGNSDAPRLCSPISTSAKKLFQDKTFYLHGPFVSSNCPPKHDMVSLIVDMGGTIVKCRPSKAEQNHLIIISDSGEGGASRDQWLTQSGAIHKDFTWLLNCISTYNIKT